MGWQEEYHKPKGMFYARFLTSAIIAKTDFINCSKKKSEISKLIRGKNLKDAAILINSYSKNGKDIISERHVRQHVESLMEDAVCGIMIDFTKEQIVDNENTTVIRRMKDKKTKISDTGGLLN